MSKTNKKHKQKSLNNSTEKIKRHFSIVVYFSRIVWKEKKAYFFYFVIGILANAIYPFVNIIGTKWIVNEIANPHRTIQNLIYIAAFMVVGNFLMSTLRKVANDKKSLCLDKVDRSVKTMINNVSMHIKYEDTEDPEILDMLKRTIKGYDEVGIASLGNLYHSIISNFIIFVGVSNIFIQATWILVVVLLVDFMASFAIDKKEMKINYNFFNKKADIERGIDYIINKLPSYQYGKEIRLYDSSDMILERQNDVAVNLKKIEKKQVNELWKIEKWYHIIHRVCTGLVYAILGIDTLNNKILIGEFASLASATNAFSYSLNCIVSNVMEMGYCTNVMKEVYKYLSMTINDDGDILPTIKNDIVIEFKNVSFKYPRNDKYILKNINITINSGEHIAIVGENGTGKTTFIKLICRLYKVDEGEILLNGKNINDYKFDEYVKLLSVVFQDFKMFAFSIKENIVIEDRNNQDKEIVELCEIGGIADRVNSTNYKLDTSIYKLFDEKGVEFSGGEAQKIAIVRALYKNSPIVILDEPTAALDPISEYEVYNHFNTLVDNKTAIYISHRLSSCKFCDRIIVFADNTIKEEGSHSELMKLKGTYAEMFNVQAKYYS
ncbi:ABC transporter ATP-binding protein [Eubacterium ventriosum]|uniref:ABC transporter ATP-binding protein n=1 Tax=Eubacterium ventriosum TaxID=39496 RepID=UPI00351FEB89